MADPKLIIIDEFGNNHAKRYIIIDLESFLEATEFLMRGTRTFRFGLVSEIDNDTKPKKVFCIGTCYGQESLITQISRNDIKKLISHVMWNDSPFDDMASHNSIDDEMINKFKPEEIWFIDINNKLTAYKNK